MAETTGVMTHELLQLTRVTVGTDTVEVGTHQGKVYLALRGCYNRLKLDRTSQLEVLRRRGVGVRQWLTLTSDGVATKQNMIELNDAVDVWLTDLAVSSRANAVAKCKAAVWRAELRQAVLAQLGAKTQPVQEQVQPAISPPAVVGGEQQEALQAAKERLAYWKAQLQHLLKQKKF